MALRFLLDEHLRGGRLWQAILHHNALGQDPLEVIRVGDTPDLPVGTADPDILLWAEREGRILVSRDKTTLPAILRLHLQAGHHCPGVFLIRSGSTVPQVLVFLVLAAYAGFATDFQDAVIHIP